jgi:putative transposase
VVLCHKIRLRPTAEQEVLFRQAVGVARFAWNWALARWEKQYREREKPNEGALRKQLNAVKHDLFPWMTEVPKAVPQQAVKNLGRAFTNFFEKRARYPRFKKKGKCRESARFDNGPGTFTCTDRRIKLPRVGWVRMREALRFTGRPLSAVVACVAGRWFVSVAVEIEHQTPERENQATGVGVDLGVSTAATLSTGEKLEGPKPLKRLLRKLRRLSRRHSRKKRGSANRAKAARRLARLHYRISCVRADWLHKTTTELVRRFAQVAVEDLNVRGMLANHSLARAISDIGFFEFRRQLAYKADLYGTYVHVADRFFPSSKLCSRCGHKFEDLSLSVRHWTCPSCGADHDRDLNSAVNLERQLRPARPDVKPAESPALVHGPGRERNRTRRSRKRNQ